MLGQFFHVIGYMSLAYLMRGRPVVITNFETEGMIDLIRAEKVSGFMAIATMLPRLITPSTGTRDRRLDAAGRVRRRADGRGHHPAGRRAFQADLLQAWGMSEFGPGSYLGPEAHRRALSGEQPQLLAPAGTRHY